MNNLELRENRRIRNITQGQLAEMCNVSLRTIQNWESGEVEIPKTKEKLLEKIFDKTNTSITQTVNGVGNNNLEITTLDKALCEISAQRKLTEAALKQNEKSQEQIDRLISLLEKK